MINAKNNLSTCKEGNNMKKNISYDAFVRRMVIVSTAIIGIVFILYAYIIQSQSIQHSLNEKAQVKMRLLFENLYSVMSYGGNKETIEAKLKDLQNKDPNTIISLHRFKDPSLQTHINEAFSKNKMNIKQNQSHVDFAVPITYEQKCLQCHTTGKVGDIAAVMHIEIPIMELEISLKEILTMISALFVISLIVITVIWLVFLKNSFIIPIRVFSNAIKKQATHENSNNPIHIDSNIKELQEIVTVFNEQNKALASSYQTMEILSFTDPLTHIHNRRKFDELAQLIFQESKRYNQIFALILIDLNRFKFINDEYGHDIGDKVLIHFTDIINNKIRKTDHFFRMGGDEFALILPHSTLDETHQVIVKIRQALLDQPFISDAITLSIEASFGYVHSNEADSLNDLYKLADGWMYQDKTSWKFKAQSYSI